MLIVLFFCVYFVSRITNKGEILRRINNLRYPRGNTNTYQGLQRMRHVFREGGIRDRASKVAIIITDGQPTVFRRLTEDEAQAAQGEGIQMFSVGITDNVDVNTLQYLSSNPRTLNQNYFTSTDFGQLLTILNGLLSVVCGTQTGITSASITTQETRRT